MWLLRPVRPMQSCVDSQFRFCCSCCICCCICCCCSCSCSCCCSCSCSCYGPANSASFRVSFCLSVFPFMCRLLPLCCPIFCCCSVLVILLAFQLFLCRPICRLSFLVTSINVPLSFSLFYLGVYFYVSMSMILSVCTHTPIYYMLPTICMQMHIHFFCITYICLCNAKKGVYIYYVLTDRQVELQISLAFCRFASRILFKFPYIRIHHSFVNNQMNKKEICGYTFYIYPIYICILHVYICMYIYIYICNIDI